MNLLKQLALVVDSLQGLAAPNELAFVHHVTAGWLHQHVPSGFRAGVIKQLLHLERVADCYRRGTGRPTCSVPLICAMGKSVRGKKVVCITWINQDQ